MIKKTKILLPLVGLTIALAAFNTQAGASEQKNVTKTEQTKVNKAKDLNKEKQSENKLTKGQEMSHILSSTNWQGTRVYDKNHHDLTKVNANFIGLAKYDAKSGRYEFFDAKTGKSRGDKGTFFITNDGKKRVLISESMNYQAVVDMTKLNKNVFTYNRIGKDANGNEFDDKTNKYEFFNAETGESRGDYGYFDVVHGNKIRAHVSIGANKYGAALELTELNKNKFTYKRTGKGKDGKDITIFVEHEPYNGDLKPKFSF